MPTSQDFIPIEEIRDGVVILKSGELRIVLMVSTMNFDLKSDDEQAAVIYQYQNFLNSLDFSIQIHVQSRKFNIKPYLATLESKYEEQTNELLRIQTREYIDFVRNLTTANNIMSKMFFVVVPYDPVSIGAKKGGLMSKIRPATKKSDAQDLAKFEENRSQLEQRRDVVVSGLGGLGLKTEQLDTESLVELYYKIFNPGEENAPKMPGKGEETY